MAAASEAGFREPGDIDRELRSLAYAGSPFAVEMCAPSPTPAEPCGICMEKDGARKAVATPPCGHWVCHGCAVCVQRAGGGGHAMLYKCPFCRQLYPPAEILCRAFVEPGEEEEEEGCRGPPPKLARLHQTLAGLPAGAEALVVVGSRAVASIVANDPVLRSAACAVSACTHADLCDGRLAAGAGRRRPS